MIIQTAEVTWLDPTGSDIVFC